MSYGENIPGNQVRAIGLASAAVLCLNYAVIPLWIYPVFLICALWRIRIYQGKLHFPGRWLKILLLGSVASASIWQFSLSVTLEFFVTLLCAGVALKFIELHNRRDVLLVLYLLFFITMTVLLFEQGVLVTLLVMLSVIVILSVFIVLYSNGHMSMLLALRKSAAMTLQSIPLMLVFFIVLPKLPPLWAMPLNKRQAIVSIDTTMSPGAFSNLILSSKVAFRAKFKGQALPRSEWYWRGLVLSSFDGRSWVPAVNPGEWTDIYEGYPKPVGSGQDYSVILEPTFRNWLYTMQYTPAVNDGTTANEDNVYFVKSVIDQKRYYEGTVYPGLDWKLRNREHFYNFNTAIPGNINPRTRELALSWKKENSDPEFLIKQALELFNKSFRYTLKPAKLDIHPVDDFLFRTREGFCEHFSSAFVVLMRAAGVPARVVVGYQGGEFNNLENYIVVRQFDAHAWAEVWLEGKGWVRVDPTAAVAPERVDAGFESVFEGSEAFDEPLSLLAYKDVPLLNRLRLQMDRFNYLWAMWVLGYNTETQKEFLSGLLGQFSPLRLAIGMAMLFGILAGIVWLYVQLSAYFFPSMHPATRLWHSACQLPAGLGYPPEAGETPADYVARLETITGLGPLAADLKTVCRRYYTLMYAGSCEKAAFAGYKSAVHEFRRNYRSYHLGKG